jgi:chemotaxis methyl-accepting protein methylase
MAVIVYSSISELARRLESELSEEEFKQLIRELVRNNTAEFHEYRRDSLAAGNYAPIVRVCLACGRPI